MGMFKDYFLGLAISIFLVAIFAGIIARVARHPTVLGLLVLLVRTRFSVMVGMILLGLPFLAWAEPGMVRAVFVLRNPYQFISLTWATLMVSLMVVVTFRVTYLTGPARFGDIPNARIPQFWGAMNNSRWIHSWWIWLGMGLAIPVYALDQSLSERPSDHSLYLMPAGLSIGILLAVAFLFLLAALQRLLIDPSITNHGLLPFENLRWIRALNKEQERVPSRLEAKVARVLGPKAVASTMQEGAPVCLPSQSTGYIRLRDPLDPDSWELEPGHAQIALVWVVLTLLYIGLYGAFLGAIGDGQADDWLPNQQGVFPTLFFIMIYVFFVGFTLTGASFFLDYYRVPTTLGLIGLVLISFSLGRVDHFYELHPEPLVPASTMAQSVPQQVPLAELFDEQWRFPRYSPIPNPSPSQPQPKSTLVVVTAAGGGIQASAWTARVLTGLDELFGGFSESIGLVSSVSGGSVGAMFYLHNRGDRTNNPDAPMQIDPQTIQHIQEDASASGLEPAAWGMAFPDLIRTTFPPAVPQTLDRGLALELEWQRRLADRVTIDPTGATEAQQTHRLAIKDLRLLDWADKIRTRKMPAVVFNSTLVETGQRLLFSPVVTQPPLPSTVPDDSFILKASEPVEFFPCYAATANDFRANPRLVTAVRLSATFSYVSPICRPFAAPISKAAQQHIGKRLFWHVADGGYSDNEGILTATKWIERILAQRRNRERTERLPFDRILIVRINGFPDRTLDGGSDREGLLNAFLGPVLALGSVRVASQAERGDYEVQLLEEATRLRRARKLDEARQLLMSASAMNTRLETSLNPSNIATDAAVVTSNATASPQAQQAIADELERRVDDLKKTVEDNTPDVKQEVETQTQKVESALRQSRDRRREYERSVEVRSIKIQFPSDMDRPPLSWALTPTDQRQIEAAWGRIATTIRNAENIQSLPEVDKGPLGLQHLRFFFPLRPAMKL